MNCWVRKRKLLRLRLLNDLEKHLPSSGLIESFKKVLIQNVFFRLSCFSDSLPISRDTDFSHRLRDALEFSQQRKLFHCLPNLSAAAHLTGALAHLGANPLKYPLTLLSPCNSSTKLGNVWLIKIGLVRIIKQWWFDWSQTGINKWFHSIGMNCKNDFLIGISTLAKMNWRRLLNNPLWFQPAMQQLLRKPLFSPGGINPKFLISDQLQTQDPFHFDYNTPLFSVEHVACSVLLHLKLILYSQQCAYDTEVQRLWDFHLRGSIIWKPNGKQHSRRTNSKMACLQLLCKLKFYAQRG